MSDITLNKYDRICADVYFDLTIKLKDKATIDIASFDITNKDQLFIFQQLIFIGYITERKLNVNDSISMRKKIQKMYPNQLKKVLAPAHSTSLLDLPALVLEYQSIIENYAEGDNISFADIYNEYYTNTND